MLNLSIGILIMMESPQAGLLNGFNNFNSSNGSCIWEATVDLISISIQVMEPRWVAKLIASKCFNSNKCSSNWDREKDLMLTLILVIESMGMWHLTLQDFKICALIMHIGINTFKICDQTMHIGINTFKICDQTIHIGINTFKICDQIMHIGINSNSFNSNSSFNNWESKVLTLLSKWTISTCKQQSTGSFSNFRCSKCMGISGPGACSLSEQMSMKPSKRVF